MDERIAGYILDEENNPVPVYDFMELARWFEAASTNKKRIVGQMTLKNGVFVSTVFLGLDHSFGDGPPLLFETMIFNGKHDQAMKRYATWEEAMEGHQNAVNYCIEQMLKEN